MGLFAGMVEGVASVVKFAGNKADLGRNLNWVPENEMTGKRNYVGKNAEATPADVEEAIIKNAAKREFAVDGVGEFNLYKNESIDFDQPLLGVHDVYSGYESAVRTSDNLGIVGAQMDLARITDNVGTIYGRIGSVYDDGSLKFILDADDAGHAATVGLANELDYAGQYGYKANDGRYVSHKRQLELGEELAADWVELPLDELKKVVSAHQSIGRYGKPDLTDVAYAAVMKTIQQTSKEMGNMTYYRAAGLVAASMAGEVADFSQTLS